MFLRRTVFPYKCFGKSGGVGEWLADVWGDGLRGSCGGGGGWCGVGCRGWVRAGGCGGVPCGVGAGVAEDPQGGWSSGPGQGLTNSLTGLGPQRPPSQREGGLRGPNPQLTNSTPCGSPAVFLVGQLSQASGEDPPGGVSGVSLGWVLGAVLGTVVGGVSGVSWGSRAFRQKHFYVDTAWHGNTFAKNISTRKHGGW